ncbi:4'-phosphopantetheinyl transferase superfamily protein [candidate division KSB1 bacterium]|nr:4'-phosphopantetheinyl transferase superfamily protein [candidate division KSB1 bacterium]
MIRGIDIEIVDTHEFWADYEKESDRNFFTAAEIEYCQSKANCRQNYAVRYAAKKALFRSINIRMTEPDIWQEVKILNNELGKPEFHFSENINSILESNNIRKVHLSLSHVENAAIAMLVLED